MKSKAISKILTLGLAVALVFCGLPVTAGAADVGTSDVLKKGDNLTGTQVYFGSYTDGDSIGPILWHVVAKEGNTATLWTKTSMGQMAYDSAAHKSWSGSGICTWLNGTFLNGAFQLAEREAINLQYGTEKEPYGEGEFWAGKIDSRQKIVLPSVAEIGNGAGTGTWRINKAKRGFTDIWWLRSPGTDDSLAAVVGLDGDVSAGGSFVGSTCAIRPAFKLNLDSVIFTSAADGGKAVATLGVLEQVTAPNGAVKLTVESSGQTLEDVKLTGGEGTGTLEFSYNDTTATTGTNQYISCVLANSSGAVRYYGKLEDCTTDSSGTLSVPLTNVVDGTYTLKIFSEQENGPNYTDFCSKPVTMTIEVENGTGTVVNTTPPTEQTPSTPSTSTRRRSSGSGQTYSPPAAAIPTNFVVDAPKAKSALDEKGKSGAAKARIRHNGEIKVLQEAWKAFGKTPVDFDTADENGVQVRVTIPEPGKMTGDKLLSGYINGSAAENRKAHFEKWYKNKLRVIHLDQQTDWGQPVEIAAKLDLTGMNAKNLYFYSYDSKTNKYKRIENPAYRIDEKGFLHFTTEYAGDIIVSDGPLERV